MRKSDPLYLRLELLSLLDAYVDVLDNDRLEEWPDLFTDDCLYEILPRENFDAGLPAPLIRCDNKKMLRDRVVSLKKANIYERPSYRHFLSGLIVTRVEPSEVEFRLNYVVINTSLTGQSTIYQSGRYQDRVVKTANGWRFAVKRVIYDTSKVQTLLAFPI